MVSGEITYRSGITYRKYLSLSSIALTYRDYCT